jgi:hypothetical protein
MIKFLPLVFLINCAPWSMLKKDYITLSESTCIDGTILNMDQAGCESFYWGTKQEGIKLKIRCTYAPKDSFWTRMTFYAVPHNYDMTYANWELYCEDRYVKMYAIPTGISLRED